MKAIKKKLVRFIISAIVFVIAFCLYHFLDNKIPGIVAFIISYIISGYDVVWKAIKNIFSGRLFDEHFLMTVATVGALAIQEYPESSAVMLFYQLGELFQSYATNKSRKNIASLMDIRPDYANVLRDGAPEKVDPSEVNIGDEIIINPGEKVPLDGVVISGTSSINTAALSGESVPVTVSEGDDILSGGVNINGVLTVRVTKGYEESTVNQILELVENAISRKSKTENFITKFSFVYTPIVVGLAVLLTFVPPVFTIGTYGSYWAGVLAFLTRALSFLVVSCPCALVISVPLSYFGGIGKASREGILVKGSNYLEGLANISRIYWDKTGTLTKGELDIEEIDANGMSEDELISYAYVCEKHSNHPIALAFKARYKTLVGEEVFEEKEKEVIEGYEVVPGRGVKVTHDGKEILCGNADLLKDAGVPFELKEGVGTNIYVSVNGEYAGRFVLNDTVKEESKDVLQSIKALGVKANVMLTGDHGSIAEHVGGILGVDEIHHSLLPADKVALLEKGIKENKSGAVAFVGDGINDAPVLARADLGIAMGGLGSDAAIEAADVVIMTDRLDKIPRAIDIARRTHTIAKQNIWFALGVKILILLLCSVGLANMWWAVFADVGVCVLAILNSMRMLK